MNSLNPPNPAATGSRKRTHAQMTTSTTNVPQTTSNNQPKKRYRAPKQIAGYHHSNTPIPPDLTQDAIIRGYVNHLRGELLLEIVKNWTPSEIVALCPAPEINLNTVYKRVQSARQEFDPNYTPRALKKKKKDGVEQTNEEEQGGATATDPPSESLFLPTEVVAESPFLLETQIPPSTSSVTADFSQDQLLDFQRRGEELLQEQRGILRHAETIDPDFATRNWLPWKERKENVSLDRGVVNRAVEEWKAEKGAGEDDGTTGEGRRGGEDEVVVLD